MSDKPHTTWTRHLRALALGVAFGFGVVTVSVSPKFALAQADLGSISGTVADASGAVLPKATVTVTNLATGANRSTNTNGRGEYQISQLLPGQYKVTVSASGFSEASQTLVVAVGSSNTLAIKLSVTGGQTEILVAADDATSVQLDKPEISEVVNNGQVQSLPTPDRNPYALVALSGNISSDSSGGNRGVGYNISGSRSASVDILLDGAENTEMFGVGIGQSVPQEAMQEFRVVTANPGVEYGRASGGAVNVATKSGSNQFHGSAYEYNRISSFASAGYNNNNLYSYGLLTNPKARFVRNQFGYSLGGPIKHDKLFFFSATEWTRVRSSANKTAQVPLDGLISMSGSTTQSFFSSYGTLGKISRGSSMTGADIYNSGLWKSDLVKLAGGTPTDVPNSKWYTTPLFGLVSYQVPADSGGGNPQNTYNSFNRIDWTISDKTSLFGRYIILSENDFAGTVNSSPYAGYNTGQTQYNNNALVSLTHAFSPSLSSTTKFLFSRFNNKQPLGTVPVSPTLYINPSTAQSLGGTNIIFPGYSATSPGNAIPFGGPQNFAQIVEDIEWIKGKHTIRFGGEYLYLKDNRTFGAYEEAVEALAASGTKNALYNFVQGGLAQLTVAINPQGAYPCSKNTSTGAYTVTSACSLTLPVSQPNFSRSNRFHDGAAYIADTYRINSRLTIDAGVRWEIYGPQHSSHPELDANFFPGTGSTFLDQIRNGQVMTRKTAPNGRLWNLNLKQFGPRLGFAFDPFGNGKTSIRGGYSISYERNFNNVTFNVIQNPPNYGVVNFTAAGDNGGVLIPISTTNLGQFASGTGTKALPNVTLRAVDPKVKPVYAQNWSLSVERSLTSTTLASIQYVGTRGIHNYSIANINRAYSGGVYKGDGYVPGRLNTQYSNINWRGSDGDSYYNGVNVSLRSNNIRHTSLHTTVNYTFSHSIDNTSSTFTDGGSNNDNLGYLDPFNHALDRGASDFDHKHRIVASIAWELPFAQHSSGVKSYLAKGWTIGTIFNAKSGNPFTMFDCYYAFSACPRAIFNYQEPTQRTGNMTNLSSASSPNTFAYMRFKSYYDTDGNLTSNYNQVVNDISGTSDFAPCNTVGCPWPAGMTQRNAFRGPGSWNQDISINKTIQLTERYGLVLRMETLNVYNHANAVLNLGGTNDVSSYTDVLAYKDGNRRTQLTAKFTF